MVIYFVKTQEYVFKVHAPMGLFPPTYLMNSDNSVFILNLNFRAEVLEDQQSEVVGFVLCALLRAGCFTPGPFSDAELPKSSLPPASYYKKVIKII